MLCGDRFCVASILFLFVASHRSMGLGGHGCRLVRTDKLPEICRSTPAGEDQVKFIIWKIDFEVCSCSGDDTFLMRIVVLSFMDDSTPVWNGTLKLLEDSNEEGRFMSGQFTSETISVTNFKKYYNGSEAHIFIYPTSAVKRDVSLPSASLFVSCIIRFTT